METLSKYPPLSKFGINPAFSADTMDIISKDWLKDRSLDLNKWIYLYEKGKTYDWAKRLTVGRWLKSIGNDKCQKSPNNRYPPIISNIGIKEKDYSPFLG